MQTRLSDFGTRYHSELLYSAGAVRSTALDPVDRNSRFPNRLRLETTRMALFERENDEFRPDVGSQALSVIAIENDFVEGVYDKLASRSTT